ncbi:ABC transporter ATP-binding protein [Paenibacillus sp. N1-5-1-14]|uniref:ABC transporter ATP-binding protein n=1 Tax=Paenibacillus radicibacter TaxID=2972488 RepID=UPI0021598D10|nr:ABC transporter ATP-binding protein [Paenibacillus radicibacter]MCR8644897.1 ABC transporter ATP-binding protein [Paenibacillus radicibacter]
MEDNMIKVEHVSRSFGEQTVLQDVSFQIHQGEFVGIIGTNGSGKTTLLRLISGVDTTGAGDIQIRGKKIAGYPRKVLAKFLAVLSQDALPPIGFTVREIIEMGRYPFQNWLGEEAVGGVQLVENIIDKLQLRELSERSVDDLSGGQRQRVALGKVMAQEPSILLLDEPTTFLDIGYQLQMMDYIRKWQEECQMTVVAVLHDLNLAAQYCTRLLVLHDGVIIADGSPQEVLTQKLVQQVYGTVPVILPHPSNGLPQILLQPGMSE